jgi:hypothetical protein
MKKIINNIFSGTDRRRKWMAIAITLFFSILFTVWGVYGIEEYGIALFIFTPLFIGAAPVILYGLQKQITQKQAVTLALLTLSIFTFLLLLFAMEGLICIAMAAPIAIAITWIGSVIGHAIISRMSQNGPTTLLILLAAIPAVAFIDKSTKPALTSVVTSIEINADLQTVWENVVAFPRLDEPTEFIFKTGIAYPIDAKIEGSGVGAIRHCNFTTGSFVEPITVWDPPNLLKFDVAEQPQPMKEISFWDINAPHLHDYFISKEGQFKLTKLPNGNTLLEGTTWYYHNIKPAFYWRIWSNHIIHKIHNRVLMHIKKNAEQNKMNN